ncbi:hypothetical protein BHU72_01975 [Desulfuribacillus stibiiarsenatis]|uniref:Copper amine oxidase-like N-terminal domain-containing protein n=1 Tax=Desulfuribacillus stibiiarsenatis TaxID=1390249 RepID=A0A1E5L648_9FIRM|nr:copper amine oxidase N-terminal domain-containing protein [Desulfuribacillus stibiiarsenatis]OEH85591.1 hypothetical protein BHU72_01975 [Desulfuribacillus stibiiarsenatis]
MRKLLSFIITILLFMGFNIGFAEASLTEIHLYVNGLKVQFNDVRPYIDSNGRTLVPLRVSAEAAEAEVTWDATLKQAKIKKDAIEIVMTVNKKEYFVNGKQFVMDSALVLNQQLSATFIPLRIIYEALGYDIEWNEVHNTGVITTYTSGAFNKVQKQSLFREISESIRIKNIKGVSGDALKTLAKSENSLADTLSIEEGETRASIADATQMTRDYLSLRTSYDGRNIESMNQWEVSMQQYAKADLVLKWKESIVEHQERVLPIKVLVDAENVRILGNKFYVSGVVEGLLNDSAAVVVIAHLVIEHSEDDSNKLLVTYHNWESVH